MDKLLSFFRKNATLQVAFVTLIALQLTVAVLQKLNQPLRTLTPGESKLDFHRQYDVSTIERIFDAYGWEGRTAYALNLVVDTFYPLFLGIAAILFILLVVRKPLWQSILILFPLVFMITDVFENMFFLFFLWTYPRLSAALVYLANIFTRIKLFTIYITFLELYLFVILTIIVFVLSKFRGLRGKTSIA
jgi:hypothetical protein